MAEPDEQSRDNQQETVAFLSSPHSFPNVDSVERIDTHAAMVFLAGDRAYKLKRAVKLPYLDFSTVDKRRAMLEAELQLNRRTAPDLYLEVRAIRRSSDGTLGFDVGEPVDWVLVLRRFAAEDLLQTVAETGGLTPLIIRQIADAIAQFHAAEPAIRGLSGSARVRRVIEGNHAAMLALPEGLLPVNEVSHLYAQTMATCDRLRGLLDGRADEGFVRYCHGDLHLKNLCLWHGKPVLFDCLEFDPELATTDTLYDLAFLVMDLVVQGRLEAANLLLNRYCDRTGEAAGLAAMPLFLSMRACVRAHVSALEAASIPDENARNRKLGESQHYLAAALAFLERRKPVLVAVGGLSGSGKSTLAAGLAPLVAAAPGARWLRSDVIRKRLAGLAPEQRLPQQAYTAQSSKAVYAAMIDEARVLLEGGASVVLDAVFATPAERDAVGQLARETQAACARIWLDAPKGVMIERVRSRIADPSDADEAVVEKQAAFATGDVSGWLRFDGRGTPADVLDRVANHLALKAFIIESADWSTKERKTPWHPNSSS